MSEKVFHISRLIEKHLRGDLSISDREELDAWLVTSTANRELFEKLNSEYWVKAELEKFNQYNKRSSEVFNQAHEKGFTRVRFMIKRLAVAASIIMVIVISSYFAFFNSKNEKSITANSTTKDIIAPSTNRAMIRLSDGSIVYLDSSGNGTLASQSGVNVIKTADGKIIYNPPGAASKKGVALYNTLINPRGSKVIDMTLTDGSRVWLNAGSSVTYPVVFNGHDRVVTITGEAYFEISQDASKPFKVIKGDLKVEVLGTHFNVNAYDDESEIKVTLLEGSVKVSTAKQLNASTIISPGQQARITKNKVETVNDVDLESVMSWKNGIFYFNNSNIEMIMRQVANWYDVEVEYQGNVRNEYFGGTISRSENISQLIKALELTKTIKIKIQGKKLIISPYH